MITFIVSGSSCDWHSDIMKSILANVFPERDDPSSTTPLIPLFSWFTRYNRFLTCREALRLQGFPDDFHLDSSPNKCYKQIGNSMSTNVLCHLYYEIFKSIL